MKILSLDSKYWDRASAKGVERSDLVKLIELAAADAAELLPHMPPYVNIILSPTTKENVIAETGEAGITYSDEYITLSFDAELPHGLESLKSSLVASVFHELVHAVTFAHYPWRPSPMFGLVSEGLATAFERDNTQRDPLWGEYGDDDTMYSWYMEVKALPGSTKDRRYFFEHEDGRRWIIYKTGTWMVDKLIASGFKFDQLLSLSHTDIIDKFEGAYEPTASA